jgi:hypothetical protein
MITASMAPVGDNQTTVKIHTDLGLSGKIASFGRGAIEDVSKKILGQFTENLRQKLETEGGSAPAPTGSSAAPTNGDSAPAEAAPTTGTASSGGAEAVASAPSSTPIGERPSVRKISGPEAEPVDLLAVSGKTMAKRVLPAAGGVALIIILLYWLLGRG